MANFDSVLQNVTILRLLFIADIWSHWRRRYFWRKFEEGWRNRETNFLKFRPRSATRCECRCRRRRRRRRRRHRCHRSRPHKSRRLRCGRLERRIQKHFFPKFTHTDCIFWHHPISLAFVIFSVLHKWFNFDFKNQPICHTGWIPPSSLCTCVCDIFPFWNYMPTTSSLTTLGIPTLYLPKDVKTSFADSILEIQECIPPISPPKWSSFWLKSFIQKLPNLGLFISRLDTGSYWEVHHSDCTKKNVDWLQIRKKQDSVDFVK